MEGAPPGDRPDRLSRFRSFDSPGARGEFEPFLRRLAALVLLVVGIVAAGSIAYSLTESVSVWQGFLFTLDTVATVGSDPTPPDLPGQIVKVLLIVLGVGTLFYALVTVTEFFVAGHLGEILEERRTLNKIEDLSDHHLICGFGRVGRQVARDLRAGDVRFVVIDELDDNKHIADQMGAPFLLGRPSEDEMLKAGGSIAPSPSSPASTPTRRTSSPASPRGSSAPTSRSSRAPVSRIPRRSCSAPEPTG